MERFCPECGTQRADGASFCGQCGHAFAATAPGSDLPDVPVPAPAPPSVVATESVPPPPLASAPSAALRPEAGSFAPPPAPARSAMSGQRIILIIAGLTVFCFGLYKLLDGLGVFSGRDSGSASSSPSANSGINEQWLMGTWTPSDRARCATWVRFDPDHTLVDESGGRGTWQLSSYGVATGRLTLTMGSLPPRTMEASRSAQDVLGFPGPRYWNRATC